MDVVKISRMTHLGRDRLFGAPISLAPALRPEREAEIDPTLAERQSDAAPRHDCRVGNDAALTTLRCDKLMMLALGGLERPCAWSEAECGRRWTFKSEHRGT